MNKDLLEVLIVLGTTLMMISLRLKRKKARGSQVLLAKDLKKENHQIRGTPLICSQTKILSLEALPLFVIKQNEFRN